MLLNKKNFSTTQSRELICLLLFAKKSIMYLCTAKLVFILIDRDFLVIVGWFDKLFLALSYLWREHSGILHFFQQQNALAGIKGGIPSLLSSGLFLSHIIKTYLPSNTFLKVFLRCSWKDSTRIELRKQDRLSEIPHQAMGYSTAGSMGHVKQRRFIVGLSSYGTIKQELEVSLLQNVNRRTACGECCSTFKRWFYLS